MLLLLATLHLRKTHMLDMHLLVHFLSELRDTGSMIYEQAVHMFSLIMTWLAQIPAVVTHIFSNLEVW